MPSLYSFNIQGTRERRMSRYAFMAVKTAIAVSEIIIIRYPKISMLPACRRVHPSTSGLLGSYCKDWVSKCTNTGAGTATDKARAQRKTRTLRFRSQIAYVRNIKIPSESMIPKTESHATVVFRIRHSSADGRVNLAERLKKVSTKGRYRFKTNSAVLIDHGRGQTYSISWSSVHRRS